jgi:hypothetical protein
MSLYGDLPTLDAAVFADTQREPAAVYEHLAKLRREADRHNVPVYTVTAGDLLAAVTGETGRYVSMPAYTADTHGKRGKVKRQCTRDFKINPIRQKVSQLRREAGAARVEQWFGITTDEAGRVKDPDVLYVSHVYPFLDLQATLVKRGSVARHTSPVVRRDGWEHGPSLRMHRRDCHAWLAEHGWGSVPRSACTFCPNRRNAGWRLLRDTDPAAWAEAVEVDERIRTGHGSGGQTRNPVFLHESLLPLTAVDLSTEEERGQQTLFAGECEGMCGL